MEPVLIHSDIDVHYVAVLQRSPCKGRGRVSHPWQVDAESALNWSGMPCVTTLLMLVQQDLGKPR